MKDSFSLSSNSFLPQVNIIWCINSNQNCMLEVCDVLPVCDCSIFLNIFSDVHVVILLLTKLACDCTGRISVLCLLRYQADNFLQ